jgi:hypothetical protein
MADQTNTYPHYTYSPSSSEEPTQDDLNYLLQWQQDLPDALQILLEETANNLPSLRFIPHPTDAWDFARRLHDALSEDHDLCVQIFNGREAFHRGSTAGAALATHQARHPASQGKSQGRP